MARHALKAILAVTIAISLLLPPIPVANACGPYLIEAIFTDMKAPDFDYGEYLQGKLGILQPSYYDMFLFAGYRNLSGAPFTKDELAVLNPAINTNATAATTESQRRDATTEQPPESTLWHKAAGDPALPRAEYADANGVIRSESRDGAYIEYYNCLPDAFKTARERLEQHRKQFGADNPAVASWLEAQRKVFANCGQPYQYNRPPQEAVIPVAATESDPPAIRVDREYQIAAAHFYAGHFSDAALHFEQISKKADSPWRGIAAYLQARALIREGTIGEKEGVDEKALSQAEELLQKIVADPKQSAIKPAAKRRLDFLAARLHPEERRIELAARLTRPGGSANFDQDKTDYFWLLDHQGYTLGTKDDLTDWISTMKLKTPAATDEAVAQWKKTKSLPWLVAAICKTDAARPEVSDLLKAAQQVSANSPAHTTILFHSLRLRMKLAKDPSTITPELDRVLGGEFKEMPNSARNQFLALRLSVANTYDEFLQFSARIPAGVAYTYDVSEDGSLVSPMGADRKNPPARFDTDAATVLSERLPLRMLVTASKSEKLPVELERMVTLAAWTRSVVLKNDSVSQEIAPRVTQLAPELKPAMESYFSAKTPEERSFAAVYAILRSPGLRPFVDSGQGRDTSTEKLDNLHDNWWCSLGSVPANQQIPGNYSRYPWSTMLSPLKQIYEDGKVPAPQFLSNEETKSGSVEFDSLTKLPNAPNWLGSEVLAFANSRPDDPRVPEALHLVVRSTRFGCTDDASGKISKSAFDLLHKKYPDSTWTKQTPYWFKY